MMRWSSVYKFCISCCLVLLCGQFAEAATLGLSPATGVYTAGGTFTARIVVNTEGQTINAAEGTLSFNASELAVVSVQKGSVFNLWTAEPSFSNTAGTVSFSGGSPTGYSGSKGTILTVVFRPKGSGASKVSYTSGSVLAADGRGTNVLTGMSGGAYTIAAAETQPEPEVIEYVAPANTPALPTVISATHPDPTQWYQKSTAELSWNVPAGVTAVRTLLDSSAGSIPTKVYESPISKIELTDLDEGVQYFHIQFQNADGWGRVAHYRLAVDTHKPSAFTISLPETADLSSPDQNLNLDVTDATSPVRRYLVQLDGKEPYEYIDESGSSTLPLSDLAPGHHTLIVEAFDAAGNSIISTYSFAIVAFDRPQFTDFPTELHEGVIPVIKGITRPNSEVVVTVTPVGETTQAKQYQLQSDETGVFTFIPDTAFSYGVYQLQAVATDQSGAQSEPSETITIAVQKPGYILIGNLLVSILSVLMPLVALLLLLGLAVVYFWRRLQRIRKGVVAETDEALQIVTAEFAKIRATLATQKKLLAESRKTKKLTKAEETLLQDVEAALLESEKHIHKEVSDVDDQV